MYGSTSLDPYIGKLFAKRYLINAVIVQGGMGDIYQATDTQTGQVVALKLLKKSLGDDRVLVQRFLRESQVSLQLKHPHICESYDTGYTDEGRHFLTMELLRGRSLDKVLAHEGALSPSIAVNFIIQAACALFEAHNKGVVHRDLKPSNLFIVEIEGTPPFVKILDFGIASLLNQERFEPKLTNKGQTLGTPFYMSSEQIRGEELDGRSDIYSLSVILWECLFASPPFTGRTPLQIFKTSLEEKLPKLPKKHAKDKVYTALYQILSKGLQKNKEKRYASMREFQKALEDLDLGEASTSTHSSAGFAKIKHPTIDNIPAYRHVLASSKLKIGIVIALISSVVILGTIYLISYAIPPKKQEKTLAYQTVKLFSNPKAEIWIEDKLMGQSPLSLDLDLEPPFELALRHENYPEYRFMVRERSEEIQGVFARLERTSTKQINLSVTTIPPGAQVRINGEKHLFETPCVIPLEGKRNVTLGLSLDGYRSEKILVSTNGGSVSVTSTLFPLPKDSHSKP